MENAEVVELYRSRLGARYQWQQMNRTGDRGDGLVSLVRHGIAVGRPPPPRLFWRNMYSGWSADKIYRQNIQATAWSPSSAVAASRWGAPPPRLFWRINQNKPV